MGYLALFEDFHSRGVSEGMHDVESNFDIAWAEFQNYDGSMLAYFAEKKTTHPHRFMTPHEDMAEHAALYSVGAQAAFVREHGEQAARELLATEGLTLGHVKPAAEKVDNTPKGANNPYSDNWVFKGTPEEKKAEREKQIAALINNKSGTRLAASLAKSAGKTISGQPLQATGAARMQRR